MAGERTDKEKINHTLEKVCDILNENNINDWFIFFGTLLGIVRENSCIQGDNDLDIMINHDYQEVRLTFEQEGFEFVPHIRKNKPFGELLLKSRSTAEFSSFDFYFCEVTDRDYYTPWHKAKAINCQPLDKQSWRSTTLNLPNDYMNKIVSMYGKDWRIPRSGHCPTNIVI
jgi:hypothetical protein